MLGRAGPGRSELGTVRHDVSEMTGRANQRTPFRAWNHGARGDDNHLRGHGEELGGCATGDKLVEYEKGGFHLTQQISSWLCLRRRTKTG